MFPASTLEPDDVALHESAIAPIAVSHLDCRPGGQDPAQQSLESIPTVGVCFDLGRHLRPTCSPDTRVTT